MAEEKKKSFPRMSVSHWWLLRDRFKQSIPGVVTENYIATVLNMSISSARTNVLPPLKQIGIINEDGKPQEMAKKWRDDKLYPEVCEEIKKNIYPNELIDAIPNPENNKEATARWFANTTGAGEVAVGKMVSFYSLLCQADPTKTPIEKKKSEKPKKIKIDKKQKVKFHENKKVENNDQTKLSNTMGTSYPEININLQIHISSDASPDQIDKIFESMAKHIYRRKLISE